MSEKPSVATVPGYFECFPNLEIATKPLLPFDQGQSTGARQYVIDYLNQFEVGFCDRAEPFATIAEALKTVVPGLKIDNFVSSGIDAMVYRTASEGDYSAAVDSVVKISCLGSNFVSTQVLKFAYLVGMMREASHLGVGPKVIHAFITSIEKGTGSCTTECEWTPSVQTAPCWRGFIVVERAQMTWDLFVTQFEKRQRDVQPALIQFLLKLHDLVTIAEILVFDLQNPTNIMMRRTQFGLHPIVVDLGYAVRTNDIPLEMNTRMIAYAKGYKLVEDKDCYSSAQLYWLIVMHVWQSKRFAPYFGQWMDSCVWDMLQRCARAGEEQMGRVLRYFHAVIRRKGEIKGLNFMLDELRESTNDLLSASNSAAACYEDQKELLIEIISWFLLSPTKIVRDPSGSIMMCDLSHVIAHWFAFNDVCVDAKLLQSTLETAIIGTDLELQAHAIVNGEAIQMQRVIGVCFAIDHPGIPMSLDHVLRISQKRRKIHAT